MPRKCDYEMEGGDIFKKIKKGVNKTIVKPASKQVFNPLKSGLTQGGIELGKFTNKELLPAVVSTGIPLAGTALGALGAMYGVPPEMTSSLTENLLKEYIPKQYQSNNKYVGLFGDALNMGIGGADPMSMMKFQQDLTGAVSKDVRKQMKQPIPASQLYNPDNPYQDLMSQLMSKYYQPEQPQTIQSSQPFDTNTADDFDARYGDSELGRGADSMRITKPPYQQKEGNVDALFGGGLKKRRGRPKKIIEDEEVEIYVKKKPSYKKFSHAKNSSLEQLLEAKSDREEKEAKKAMKEVVEKQKRYLASMGYGIMRGRGDFDDDDELSDIFENMRIVPVIPTPKRPSQRSSSPERPELDIFKPEPEVETGKKKKRESPVENRAEKKSRSGRGVKGSEDAKKHMAYLRSLKKKK